MARSELMHTIKAHLLSAGWQAASITEEDDMRAGLWIDPERPEEDARTLTTTLRATMEQVRRETAA